MSNGHPDLEQLQAYAEGDEQQLRPHIQQCETCRANLRLLSEIDRGLKSLPDLPAPEEQWDKIVREVKPKRSRPLLAASIGFIALLGTGLLVKQVIDRSTKDPVAQLEAIYNDAGDDPQQQAATLKALSDATHEAVEKEPDNAALHDLAYAIDRKRNEIKPIADTPDSSTVDSVRAVAEPSVEAIARTAPRVQLFNHTARAFAGAQLLPIVDGLRVVDVLPGSPAAAAGLKPDDVLLSANGTALQSVDELATAAGTGSVRIELRRGSERITSSLQLTTIVPR